MNIHKSIKKIYAEARLQKVEEPYKKIKILLRNKFEVDDENLVVGTICKT